MSRRNPQICLVWGEETLKPDRLFKSHGLFQHVKTLPRSSREGAVILSNRKSLGEDLVQTIRFLLFRLLYQRARAVFETAAGRKNLRGIRDCQMLIFWLTSIMHSVSKLQF